MRAILAKEGQELDIGKRGENLAVCIVFDISEWKRTYGEGTVQLIHQRNGDKYPYPCVVKEEGDSVRWEIGSADTGVAGKGHAELQYWVGDTIVKSATFNTNVVKAMSAAGDIPPAPVKAWLDKLLQLGAESEANAIANALAAKEAAQEALEAAQAAERAAKEAKDAADDIIHGDLDYCTRPEAQAYANTAEGNAKAYADAQIEAAIGVAIGGSY